MKKYIEISEINIVPVKPKDGLIGFVSFVIDERFYVGNVAIFSRLDREGIRLVYPKKGAIDCFHPIKRDVGDFINKKVTEKFNTLLKLNELKNEIPLVKNTRT
jgi:DNA-binding cell septation regulator SpoVG